MTVEQADAGHKLSLKIKLYQNALDTLLTDDPQLDRCFSILIHDSKREQIQGVIDDFIVKLKELINGLETELSKI